MHQDASSCLEFGGMWDELFFAAVSGFSLVLPTDSVDAVAMSAELKSVCSVGEVIPRYATREQWSTVLIFNNSACLFPSCAEHPLKENRHENLGLFSYAITIMKLLTITMNEKHLCE